MALYSFEERSQGGLSVRSVPDSVRGPLNPPRRGTQGNPHRGVGWMGAPPSGPADASQPSYAQGIMAAHSKSLSTRMPEKILPLQTGHEYLNKHSLAALAPPGSGRQCSTDRHEAAPRPGPIAGHDGAPPRDRTFAFGHTLGSPTEFAPQIVSREAMTSMVPQYGRNRETYLAGVDVLPPEVDPSVNPTVPRSGPGSPIGFFMPDKLPSQPVYVLGGDAVESSPYPSEPVYVSYPFEPREHYPPSRASSSDVYSQGSLRHPVLPAGHPLTAVSAAERAAHSPSGGASPHAAHLSRAPPRGSSIDRAGAGRRRGSSVNAFTGVR